jgi:hypothetical protein
MQNLKIKAELAGKTITRDLGWTRLTIKIDNIKPAQYGRLFQMGLTEIFENGKEEKREHTSNEVVEGTSANDGVVEKVQEAPKRKRKSKLA